MEASDHDERLRRLQRIAYGADAAPDERAAAEAELRAMAVAAESSTAAAETAARAVPDDAATTASAGDVAAPEHEPSASAMRWAIGVGAAALVAGIAVGVGVSGLAAAPPIPGSPASADVLGADTQAGAAPDLSVVTGPGTPVERTPVYEVFVREQRPADAVAEDVLAGGTIDRTSTRLLMSRSDGVDLFAATMDGGEELCVVVVATELGGSGSACTDGGILPPEGLTVSFGFTAQGPPVTASLHADGTAGLNASEEPAGG